MKAGKISWLSVACLLMEGVALIFVTLVLICPAPFEHSNLALIVVGPSINTTSTSGNSSYTSTSSISNATHFGSETSSVAPHSTNSANANISTASPINTDVSKAVSDSLPTATASTSSSTTRTESVATAIPSKRAGLLYTPMVMKREKLSPNTTGIIANSSVSKVNSTVLLRIGPLGSCFRDSDNVETCTSARLYSSYDYTQLESASFTTDGLVSGMSTYPIILLIIVISLCVKVALDTAVIVAPKTTLLESISSPSSTWHTIANWLICGLAIVLVIASGIEKNKLSNDVDSFNTSNLNKTIDATPLTASTGTSFGFLWIAVALLIVSFLFKRFGIKKQQATDRAMHQVQENYGQAYLEQQLHHQLPYQSPSFINHAKTMNSSSHNQWHVEQQSDTATKSRRQSGLDVLRHFLPSHFAKSAAASYPAHTMAGDSGITNPATATNETLILDDFVRRHYYAPSSESVLAAPPIRYVTNDAHRMQAKESPPFHSYQTSFEGDQQTYNRAKRDAAGEASLYAEDIRSKMASPAPTYWTSNDRVQNIQDRREQERLYMAELRKLRSAS
ncbi:hypothetical protein CBS101457_005848 [Exobasidium rhododendri]|nr:hypothetical protein CBS101457_005848 [Exobasidium rhododendri]